MINRTLLHARMQDQIKSQSNTMRLRNFLLNNISNLNLLIMIKRTANRLSRLISLFITRMNRIKQAIKNMRLQNKRRRNRNTQDLPDRQRRLMITKERNIKRLKLNRIRSLSLSTNLLRRHLMNINRNLLNNIIARRNRKSLGNLTTLNMMTILARLMTINLGNLLNIVRIMLNFNKRIILMALLRQRRRLKTQLLNLPIRTLRLRIIMNIRIRNLNSNLTRLRIIRQLKLTIMLRRTNLNTMTSTRLNILSKTSNLSIILNKNTRNISLTILRNISKNNNNRLLMSSLIRLQLITPPLLIQRRNSLKIKRKISLMQANYPLIIQILSPTLNRNLQINNLQIRRDTRSLLPQMMQNLMNRLSLLQTITLLGTNSAIRTINTQQIMIQIKTIINFPHNLRNNPISIKTIIPLNLQISIMLRSRQILTRRLRINRRIQIRLGQKTVSLINRSRTKLMPTPRLKRMTNITIEERIIPIQTSFSSKRNRHTTILSIIATLIIIMALNSLQRKRITNMQQVSTNQQFNNTQNITKAITVTHTTTNGRRNGHHDNHNRHNRLAYLIRYCFLLCVIPAIVQGNVRPSNHSIKGYRATTTPNIHHNDKPIIQHST